MTMPLIAAVNESLDGKPGWEAWMHAWIVGDSRKHLTDFTGLSARRYRQQWFLPLTTSLDPNAKPRAP
ncbi:hypothetical protein [Cupriavidus plantarum]|uniref:hypothetical protein n=1 Tax=Cupriavidus plantarum TaxID=942865 RepID=UPI001BA858E1|nr:hypothetical protein [Cupriavidus plantarum]